MRAAYYTILSGLVIQTIGFLWDFWIHSQNGVKEGVEEFFKVPAHDFVIGGFAIVGIGFILLTKSLWQKKQ